VFFLDADLQSRNGIYTVPLAALGLTPGQKFSFSVDAVDNYFTGTVTDSIPKMTFTLDKPRYTAEGDGGDIDALTAVRMPTSAPEGGAEASPSQTGFLALFRQNRGNESTAIQVRP
jgi:hypothetical protein